MQEGVFSLMRMPRTTVAVNRLKHARLSYIVVLTNPTTGGVTASYAMLGEVHIAEPGALRDSACRLRGEGDPFFTSLQADLPACEVLQHSAVSGERRWSDALPVGLGPGQQGVLIALGHAAS